MASVKLSKQKTVQGFFIPLIEIENSLFLGATVHKARMYLGLLGSLFAAVILPKF
jgi:hypothetical protein